MKNFRLLLGLFISLLLVSCKYNPNLINGEEITVSGKIRQVGNEPFTSLVLSVSDNQTLYLILNDPEDKREYEKKIGTWQTIKGTVLIESLHTPNGKKSIDRYSLFVE